MTTNKEFYSYWKVERDVATWNPILNTPNVEDEARKRGAMFLTTLATTSPDEDGIRRGDFWIDLDSEDPALAIEEALWIIMHLEMLGVTVSQVHAFMSGGKGVHLRVPAEILGAVPGPSLHLEYKALAARIAADLDLATLDMSLYAGSHGKMLRISNVKRRNGHYRVPVMVSELTGLDAKELLELTLEPRELDEDPEPPTLVETLHEVYLQCREQVALDQNRPKTPPLDAATLELLKADMPDCIKAVLELKENTTKGNYHQYVLNLGCYFAAAGIDPVSALEVSKDFIEGFTGSATYKTPKARLDHFKYLVRYLQDHDRFRFGCGFMRGLGMPGNAFECSRCPIFKPVDASDLFENVEGESKQDGPWDSPVNLLELVDKEPSPIRWFIENRIVHGRGLLLCGVGGSSKTKLMYQLAVGAVLGILNWGWNVKTRGKSLLILTEDIVEEVHRTIHNICLGLNLSKEQKQHVYSNLICYPLAGEPCTLLALAKENAMVETPLFKELEQKIRSYGNVVFVGIDPALSVTTGNELDQGHQRALGRMCDNLAVRVDATVCMVAHASKFSLAKEELDSHNSRGGGAITDSVRSEISMRSMTKKEGKAAKIESLIERKRHVQVVLTKGNLLPPEAFVPLWLRRDNTGTLEAADIEFDTGDGPDRKSRRALEILKAMCATTVPIRAEWHVKCDDEALLGTGKEDAQKKAMQRIIDSLKKYGLIEKGHGRGIWVPTTEDDDEEEFFHDFNTVES